MACTFFTIKLFSSHFSFLFSWKLFRMAGGFIQSGSPDKNYPGKLTWRAFTTCMVAAFGGLIFGYDLGISGMFNKCIYLSIH